MIFSNDKAYHDIKIESGSFTTSYHLPLLCTITCKPTIIPVTPKSNTNKANWEQFERKKNNGMINISIEENMDRTALDNRLRDWHETVKDAMKEAIPLKTPR